MRTGFSGQLAACTGKAATIAAATNAAPTPFQKISAP